MKIQTSSYELFTDLCVNFCINLLVYWLLKFCMVEFRYTSKCRKIQFEINLHLSITKPRWKVISDWLEKLV
jgi:hypothetical protein